MMSEKAFFIEYYSTLILSEETKYNTFEAICLEQSISRILISSYLQAKLCFTILCYLVHIDKNVNKQKFKKSKA